MATTTLELPIIRFLQTLPQKERLFYLVTRAYEHDLASVSNNNSDEEKTILLDEIKTLYENDIKSILNLRTSVPVSHGIPIKPIFFSPIYEDQTIRTDKAEPPSFTEPKPRVKSYNSNEKIPELDHKLTNKDEFAETLGKWASSFSDDSDTENVDRVQRQGNESDLSSHDD